MREHHFVVIVVDDQVPKCGLRWRLIEILASHKRSQRLFSVFTGEKLQIYSGDSYGRTSTTVCHYG